MMMYVAANHTGTRYRSRTLDAMADRTRWSLTHFWEWVDGQTEDVCVKFGAGHRRRSGTGRLSEPRESFHFDSQGVHIANYLLLLTVY